MRSSAQALWEVGVSEDRPNRLIGALNPFSVAETNAVLPTGGTVLEMLEQAGADPALLRHGHVWINNEDMSGEPVYIPRENWDRVRPNPGMTIVVRIVPTGGGGGGGGKIALRIVLMIAVIALAVYLGPLVAALIPGLSAAGTAAASAAITAAIGFVGNLAINALIPPPSPRRPNLGGLGGGVTDQRRNFFINGTQNTASPYGPVPLLFGKKRIYPKLAAETYTESVGNDVFFRMLLTSGYGPQTITNHRIGETPISDFEGVEIEAREGYPWDPPLTLYTNDVHEESLSIALTETGGWVTRRTQPGIDEYTLDILFPQGLSTFSLAGTPTPERVDLEVQQSLADQNNFSDAVWADKDQVGFSVDGKIDVLDNITGSPLKRGNRVKVVNGQYDVRTRRITPDSTSSRTVDLTFWSALRSIKSVAPIKLTGITKIAVRIKATDQLQGAISQWNFDAERILSTYDPGTQTWSLNATRMAADAYAEALRGAPNKRPVADSRLNLTNLIAWRDAAAVLQADGEPKWAFDAYYEDENPTVAELLSDIASSARAKPGMPDGKHGVIRDLPQTIPVQHFTPRNSWGFDGFTQFVDPPHGIKVRFDKDGQSAFGETIAYADGFDENNATEFETIVARGIVNERQAWSEGRYHWAQGVLRPHVYSFSVDAEHIVAQRGKLIRVTHDVLKVGLGQGRLLDMTADGGGNITDITIDETMVMDAAKTYALQIRSPAGLTASEWAIATVAGESNLLTLSVAIPVAQAPEIGDLVAFGETNLVSIDAIVKDIEPEEGYNARLLVVDAAPAVHDADSVIPAFDPQLTQPPDFMRKPGKPVLLDVRSDEGTLLEGADGSLASRILVALGGAAPGTVAPAFMQVRYRRKDSNGRWSHLARLDPMVSTVSVMPVDDGVEYEVELTNIGELGQPSDALKITHTVIGQTTPPPDPFDARLEGDYYRWGYPARPRDFQGWQVRHRSGVTENWLDAAAAHEGFLTDQQLDISALPKGTRAIMVKAFDRSGNESVRAASFVVNLGDPVPDNVVLTDDRDAAGFPGTIVDGAVAAGELRADDTGTLYLTNPSALYLTDPAAIYLPTEYKEMSWETIFTPAAADLPAGIVVDLDVAGNWMLDYRFDGSGLFLPDNDAAFLGDDDALFLGGGGGSFVPWPGRIEAGPQDYTFRVKTASGAIRGVVKRFHILLDVPDLGEQLVGVAIAAGGTRLPITQPYRTITKATLTVKDDAGTAVSARIFDLDATLGPLGKTFDISNVSVAGTVDADIQGY